MSTRASIGVEAGCRARHQIASAARTHTARPHFVAVLEQDTYAVAACRGFNSRGPPLPPNGAPDLHSAPRCEPTPAAKMHTRTACAHAAPCTCAPTAHTIVKLSQRPRLARLWRTQRTRVLRPQPQNRRRRTVARGANTATQRSLHTRAAHRRTTTTSDDVTHHGARRYIADSPRTHAAAATSGRSVDSTPRCERTCTHTHATTAPTSHNAAGGAHHIFCPGRWQYDAARRRYRQHQRASHPHLAAAKATSRACVQRWWVPTICFAESRVRFRWLPKSGSEIMTPVSPPVQTYRLC